MRRTAVIPVIGVDEVAHAVPMARALLAGGIRMLEVTCARRRRWPASRPSRARCRRPWWAPARYAAAPMRWPLPAPVPGLRSVPATPRVAGQACRDAGLRAAARCGHWQRDHAGAGGRLHGAQVLSGHAGGRPCACSRPGAARSLTSSSAPPGRDTEMRPSFWRCPMWCAWAAPGWCPGMRWPVATGRGSRGWQPRARALVRAA